MITFSVPKDLLLYSHEMGTPSDFSVRGFSGGQGEDGSSMTFRTATVSSSDVQPWTLAEITSAQWIDFNDETKRTIDAGVFSQINDKSGNSRNATASSTARPTLVTDSNGMDWAAFDGIDDFMSISVPMVNGSSIFVVVDTSELQTGDRTIFNRSTGSAPYPPAPYLGRSSGYDYKPSIFWGSAWAGSMASTFRTLGILQYRFGAGSVGMRLNGWTEESASTGQTVISTWTTLNSNSTQRSKCKIGEYVIINSAVDSTTREKIEGYLAHKWGLAAGLPSDHPYKSAAPVKQPKWTPAEITTSLWLDAADSSTITLNGSTVSEWRDKSGNARHAAQSTPSKQPIRGTNWLSFDGADDEMQLSDITTLTTVNATMFIVAKRDNTGGRSEVSFAIGNTSDLNGINDIPRFSDDKVYSTVGRTANRVGVTSSISAALYQNAVTGGTNQKSYTNGSINGTGTTQSTANVSVTSGWIGSGRAISSSPLYYFDGNIYEIIIEPSVLSDADRKIREGYLANKWDALLGVTTLVDALPSDHPYKSAPPTL